MPNKSVTKKIPLPPEVLESDLKYPKYSDDPNTRMVATFDLWYSERFGWCIPTLLIRSGRSRGTTDRTYAAALDGQVVSMGMGPHVLRQAHVYVTPLRQAALQKFLDLKVKGEGDAGSIRDRISTRRMQTVQRRSSRGGFGWML